jgi:hypothetical protein
MGVQSRAVNAGEDFWPPSNTTASGLPITTQLADAVPAAPAAITATMAMALNLVLDGWFSEVRSVMVSFLEGWW